MAGNGQAAAHNPAQAPLFTTKHWSVVLASANGADEALEELCRTYWYPLYVYVRRRGYDPEDGRDLTQGFFSMLLERDYFRLVDPKKGRFRTFLLHALEHFIINEWKRSHRGKRGGGAEFLSLDVASGEQRYTLEPRATMTPERAYEKRWALTLLDQVLASLRQEYRRAGKEPLFEELAESLWGKADPPSSGVPPRPPSAWA